MDVETGAKIGVFRLVQAASVVDNTCFLRCSKAAGGTVKGWEREANCGKNSGRSKACR